MDYSDLASSGSDVGSEAPEVETADADYGDGDGVNDFDSTYKDVNSGNGSFDYSNEPENAETGNTGEDFGNENTDSAVDQELSDFDDQPEQTENTEPPDSAEMAADNPEGNDSVENNAAENDAINNSDNVTDENVDDALADFDDSDAETGDNNDGYDEGETSSDTDEPSYGTDAESASEEDGEPTAENKADTDLDKPGEGDTETEEPSDANDAGAGEADNTFENDNTSEGKDDTSAASDFADDVDASDANSETESPDEAADEAKYDTDDSEAAKANDADDVSDDAAEGTQDGNVDDVPEDTEGETENDVNPDEGDDAGRPAEDPASEEQEEDNSNENPDNETAGDANADADDASGRPADETAEETPEESADDVPEESAEEPVDENPDETEENAPEEPTDEPADDTPDENADGTTEGNTNEPTEDMTEEPTEENPDENPDENSGDETGNDTNREADNNSQNSSSETDPNNNNEIASEKNENNEDKPELNRQETEDPKKETENQSDNADATSNPDGTNDTGNDPEKTARIDGMSYDQGNNDLQAYGTCGPTSISNVLNRVEGNNGHTENDVLHNAWDNNLCNKSDNPYARGGTSTQGVVDLIDNLKDPESNINTEVYDYGNALSVDDLANRLDDPNTVAIAGVDSATLWDQRGDVASSGLFQNTESPSDHWIMVDSPVRNENGDVVGFNIVDSGGGVDYVDRDKFERMYQGDDSHRVSDPTAIIVSNNEEAGSISPQSDGMERTANYKGSAGESDGGGSPNEMSEVKLQNTELGPNGKELSETQKEVNNLFRGDRFKESDSYENRLGEERKAELADANYASTCGFENNLDGSCDNPKYSNVLSPEQKASIQELKDLRSNVPEIKEDTVMQKVITPDQMKEYLESGKTNVTGCATRAEDAAPYTNNLEQAYRNLRLDYHGDGYDGNDFKQAISNGEDMYVIRFTSDYSPTNNMYPSINEHTHPPCTGTGFTGSEDHLIPEFSYSMNDDCSYNPAGQEITNGAIYKIDKDGNETLIGYWNENTGRFSKVE